MSQHPPVRPEYQRELAPLTDINVAQPLPLLNRLWNQGAVRKSLLLILLALLWEGAARWQNNDLLLPTFTQAATAFIEDIRNGELPAKIAISMKPLAMELLAYWRANSLNPPLSKFCRKRPVASHASFNSK